MGTNFLYEALKMNPKYSQNKDNLKVYFLSNVDPIAFNYLTTQVDPKKTLVLIVSKSFTTAETLQNASLVKNWIIESYSDSDITDDTITKTQFIAVSADKKKVKNLD